MKNPKLILAGLFTLIAASAVVLAGPSSSVWDNYWREALDLEDDGLVAMYPLDCHARGWSLLQDFWGL
jgi:hypothetical protein